MGCQCDNCENGECTNANNKATFEVRPIFSELIINLRLKPTIQPISSGCIVILCHSISTRREAAAQMCQSRGKGQKYVSQIGDLTKITIFQIHTVIARPSQCERSAVTRQMQSRRNKTINTKRLSIYNFIYRIHYLSSLFLQSIF